MRSRGLKVAGAAVIAVAVAGPVAAATGYSVPAPKVSVPDVVGKYADTASADIIKVGLVPEESVKISDTVAKGLVISQSPKTATKVASGSDVSIVVSEGSSKPTAEVAVPDVVKKYESAAVHTITGDDLSADVKLAYSSKVKKDVVISESPKAGTKLADYSKVTITVSKGAKPKK